MVYLNSAAELRTDNRERMLHGVVNISYITAADGRKLDQVFLVSDAFENKTNDHIWPNQHHVVSSDYTLWRKAMEFLFPENLQFQIKTTSGNWIIASNTDGQTGQKILSYIWVSVFVNEPGL
jgi:hypothetical protein